MYFKFHYDENQVRSQDKIIKLRGKIRTLKHAMYFVEESLLQQVIQLSIVNRIAWSPIKPSLYNEKAFLQD